LRGSVHDRAIALRDVTLVGDGDGELPAVAALIDKLDNDYQQSRTRSIRYSATPRQA
jgi:methyl-accepting chemotaxis protein